MTQSIHPEIITAEVTCSNCSTKVKLTGAFYQNKFSVEQCNKCHMAFTGQRTDTAKSSAIEKFNEKFGNFDFANKKS